MRKSPFLLLFAALTLAACAKKKDPDFTAPIFLIPTETLTEAQKYAADPSVSCDDPQGRCNPAVAMLTEATETGAGACTATLVSEDVALTNSHCIPNDLKPRGSSCQNRIWLTFPKHPDRPDYDAQVRCREIISASDLGDGEKPAADYALIRLEKRVNRPPLKLSRDGFADGELVTITRVDPYLHRSRAYGGMRSMTCKAVHGTSILPNSGEALSDLMIFADCKVIRGNSGSAIQGADGAVKGVIQALFNPSRVKDLLDKGGIRLFDGTIAHLNLGTSMACLAGLNVGGAPRAACASRMSEEELEDKIAADRAAGQQRDFTGLVSAKLQIEQVRWEAELRTAIEPGFAADVRRIYADPRPACVVANKMPGPHFHADVVQLPLLELVSGVDRYLRESRRVLDTGLFSMGRLLLDAAGDGKWRVFHEVSVGTASSRPAHFEKELGACSGI